MVELSFKYDERVVRQDGAAIAEMDPSLLGALLPETLFIMPIRWRVNDVDVLQIAAGKSPWLDLPVFSVNRDGRTALEEALRNGKAVYSLPGSGTNIRLTRRDDYADLTVDVTGVKVRDSFEGFRTAFDAFHTELMALVRREIPRLLEILPDAQPIAEGSAAEGLP
jgi:hypothetical protein